MFRSALLALKPSPAQSYVVELAIGLAQHQAWHLAACTVVDQSRVCPPEPVPLGAGSIKHELDQKRLADAHKAAELALASFHTACAAAQLPCHATIQEGETVPRIAQQIAERDVLLVGHSGGDDTGDESLLFQILKHCPRPALVLPRQTGAGSDIVVAYDGSYQAARTLASFAYSGLASGRSVHVVACDPKSEHAHAVAGAACRFLHHHNIKATAHVEHGGDPAQALLTHAERTSAALLVMGAFGKSRFHEFLFGSVTRRILHELPLPVFLDH